MIAKSESRERRRPVVLSLPDMLSERLSLFAQDPESSTNLFIKLKFFLKTSV